MLQLDVYQENWPIMKVELMDTSQKSDAEIAWTFVIEELTRQGMSPLQIWCRMNGAEEDYIGCPEN